MDAHYECRDIIKGFYAFDRKITRRGFDEVDFVGSEMSKSIKMTTSGIRLEIFL